MVALCLDGWAEDRNTLNKRQQKKSYVKSGGSRRRFDRQTWSLCCRVVNVFESCSKLKGCQWPVLALIRVQSTKDGGRVSAAPCQPSRRSVDVVPSAGQCCLPLQQMMRRKRKIPGAVSQSVSQSAQSMTISSLAAASAKLTAVAATEESTEEKRKRKCE